MGQKSPVLSSKRSRLVTWIAGVAALAMVGTIAVVVAGYDARETPREEPSVWAMRSTGQYARVNTLTAEIDTVRSVDDPSGLVQSGAEGVVLTNANARAWAIDPTMPQDFQEAAEARKAQDAEVIKASNTSKNDDAADSGSADTQAESMPDGTRDVIAAGDQVLVRTESGEAYVGSLQPETSDTPVNFTLIDPFAGETTTDDAAEARKFIADAAAIDAEGRVALLSVAAQEVRWYSVERGTFTGVDRLPEGITAEELQLAIVDGSWVALNGANLWRSGSKDPVALALDATPKLQASSLRGDGLGVLIADGDGLWRVSGDEPENIAKSNGVPAQPIAVAGEQFAAWVGEGQASLWRSETAPESSDAVGELKTLEVDDSVKMPGDPEPVFRSNGSTALLTEVKTGMLWTVPEGRMIPVEQWTLADPPKERDGTVVVADVTEQEPPVAVDDAFGVRANDPALLPVLLNDYDPNRKDVLTIVTEGLGSGLDAKFGTVTATTDSQTLVFTPGKSATGSATISYRITDGVHLSEPATITLTVMPEEVNTAPEWCGVENCTQEWPAPEMTPGGTIVMPILEGWVDPEGDPMLLESAKAAGSDSQVRALVTDDGRLAVRHLDANDPGGEAVVKVTVADARGESTTRDLTLQVRSNAKAELGSIATTVEVDQTITVRPLTRVVGGSGSYVLADASVQSGNASVTVASGGAVSIRADQAGQTLVALSVRDNETDQEVAGVLRVTAVPTHAKLGIGPMSAFVRPLADTTVDVLNVVPGANSRALVVQEAKVVQGELRADVIEYANVRVSGSTADGAPGRIGSVDVTVAEGSDEAVGRMTVFQIAEQSETGAIAVPDNATVRAGSVVDIAVLDNDVSAPGQRLVLHPEIGGSGAKGELAFASGNTLRYLAPKEPGNYTLTYTTYGASSPESSDVGQVHVTVLPREGNKNPAPRALTVRLAPGENGVAQVPLSGVDPDGDRVGLVSVAAPKDAQLTATVSTRSSSIKVEASSNAKPGLQTVKYRVNDEFGGEGEGTLRIIVTERASGSSAPITYSDYVRMVAGTSEQAVVQPLKNDLDPSGGTLSLVSVVPNVAGGKDSAAYRELAARIDTSAMKKGRISVAGSDEPGTVSYRYTVRSSESLSTAEGLIVVQSSTRVGQQAPTVLDTVLSARDRVELEGGGVDVVTDRVYWATGDISTLKLSIWGSKAKKYSVSGNRISGSYQAEGDMVPFKLSGTDVTGKQVDSYGFLVIPSLDELRLTLNPSFTAIKVDEDKTREVALADIVDLGAGDTAEFKTGSAPTQRSQATCTTTVDTVSYSAGKEGPWVDTCLVSVKLTEQKTWTELSVPVQIVPKEPIAQLDPLTRTISPGATEVIELQDMVRWEGDREGKLSDLAFSVSSAGSNFELAQSGAQITVQAKANARVGAEDASTVTATGIGESQSTLTLRVGGAAKDTPVGATVKLTCDVGSTCQTPLIGAPGEYDPFAGKSGGGLKLEAIDGTACVAYGSMEVAGEGVSVAWSKGDEVPGGTCTATFTVRDAQDRMGTGIIELDVQGVPSAPSSVTPTRAGGDSVQLTVELSGAKSHPATTGVELVTEDGAQVGSCVMKTTTATCTVSGLKPEVKQTYFARAINDVGASAQSKNGATTWAYVPPSAPSLSATPVAWKENTRSDIGRVKLRIGETSAATVTVMHDDAALPRSSDDVYEVTAGTPQNFSLVVANAADRIPPAYSGGKTTDGKPVSVTAIGAPKAGTVSLTVSGDSKTDWQIEPQSWDANGAPGGLTYRYNLAEGESAPACGSGESSGTAKKFVYITATVCASTDYGTAGPVASDSYYTGGKPPAPPALNYTIARTPVLDESQANTYLYKAVAPDFGKLDGELKWGTSIEALDARTTVATVQQCVGNGECSEYVDIEPPANTTPFSVTLNNGSCVAPETNLSGLFTIEGKPNATASFRLNEGKKVIELTWSSGAYDPLEFDVTVCQPPKPDADSDSDSGSGGGSDSGSGGGSDSGSGGGSDSGSGSDGEPGSDSGAGADPDPGAGSDPDQGTDSDSDAGADPETGPAEEETGVSDGA